MGLPDELGWQLADAVEQLCEQREQLQRLSRVDPTESELKKLKKMMYVLFIDWILFDLISRMIAMLKITWKIVLKFCFKIFYLEVKPPIHDFK